MGVKPAPVRSAIPENLTRRAFSRHTQQSGNLKQSATPFPLLLYFTLFGQILFSVWTVRCRQRIRVVASQIRNDWSRLEHALSLPPKFPPRILIRIREGT